MTAASQSVVMPWWRSYRADPRARPLADRHYNRPAVGAAQFVPPGRCVVLLTAMADALWITSWPQAAYVQHAWPGAWICSAFRNESVVLSSALIAAAEAATRAIFGDPPPQGFVTFVDPRQVRRKRDPGRCFRRAGWSHVGYTATERLWVYQHTAAEIPSAQAPQRRDPLLAFEEGAA